MYTLFTGCKLTRLTGKLDIEPALLLEEDDEDDEDGEEEKDRADADSGADSLTRSVAGESELEIMACDSWLDTVLVSLELCLNMQLRSTRVIAVYLHRLILKVSKISILRRKKLR